MAFGDSLPLAESVGVFVGVAGIDWLADGYAEPLKAALVALGVGLILMIARKIRRQGRPD